MKAIKKLIRQMLDRLGYQLVPLEQKTPPRFEECFIDQQRLVGEEGKKTILDIGAHTGETSKKYCELFPGSSIIAFEPFEMSFKILEAETHSNGNVTCINAAVGDTSGKAELHVNRYSQTNSLLAAHQNAARYWGENLYDEEDRVLVDCIRLDDFVADAGIKEIDILKIDTQGTEYEVLEGAKNLLLHGHVKLVYLEIIITPTYEGQKHFDEVVALLRTYGYPIYFFYNPVRAYNGLLMQVDAIFYRSDLFDK